MSQKKRSEPLTLMDLDVEELERRLELAPNQCLVAETSSVKCKHQCGKHKVEVEV